ncbi:hypothetical protein BH24ACT13_BH24ACT13_11600 [soil metagenome]
MDWVTRRQLLGGGLAALVAGCTRADAPDLGEGPRRTLPPSSSPYPSSSRTPATPPVGQQPAPDPDAALRRRMVQEERSLLARYAATADRHPKTAALLAPLAVHHEAHLAAVIDVPGAPPDRRVRVPGRAPAALRSLAAIEAAAASSRATAADKAQPELARLLASIGACEASHAVLLRPRSMRRLLESDAAEELGRRPPPTQPGPSAVLASLQVALAGEHAASYAYGVLGAQLAGRDRERARTAYDAHRVLRDRLDTLARGHGGQPVVAAAAYELPFAVRTEADARRLAGRVEERTAAPYADLVAAAIGPERRFATIALRAAAVRAAGWRGETQPFPGLPERARR